MADKIRSRGWCFTVNNYSESDVELIRVLAQDCVYLVFGREVGEQGTPHLQGYVYFDAVKSAKRVKAILPVGAHHERAKGSAIQNFRYCSKDGDFEEFGQRPMSQSEKGEAEKERWKLARECAVSGRLDGIPDDIYVRYYRALKEIGKDNMGRPVELDGVCGKWLYGDAGTGKSRYAAEHFPGHYMKMPNKWWDGYQGEENVVMDDMDPDHAVLRHHLKRWADRYPFIGETKGGAIAIRPKLFVVTSQYSIDEMFRNKDGSPDVQTIAAIKRRFEVKHFGKNAFNPYAL